MRDDRGEDDRVWALTSLALIKAPHMKNPMDRQLEKRLSDRAVAIAREGEVAALGELLEMLRSSSANARRLAASALGKLAWQGVDQLAAVSALAPVARRGFHGAGLWCALWQVWIND